MVEPSLSTSTCARDVKKRCATENKANRKGERIKKRKRFSDFNDPERQRLTDAQLASTTPLLLPHPKSIGVGKLSLARTGSGHEDQLPTQHTDALRALFYLIVSKLSTSESAGAGVTWGEGEDEDPRRRMYGFMPQQRQALLQAGIKIQKEGAPDDREHQEALQRACVDLVFPHQQICSSTSRSQRLVPKDTTLVLDASVYEALATITSRVRALVPDNYQKYVTMEHLVAAQPNLHNGATYLPAHLDFPRQDGFGVVIVTFGVRGTGTIVLMDDGDDEDEKTKSDAVEGGSGSKSFSFRLNENEAYILCGDARNKCVHGVLCGNRTADQKDEGDMCRRETLNLRYGLHSPEFALEEVDRHWPD